MSGVGRRARTVPVAVCLALAVLALPAAAQARNSGFLTDNASLLTGPSLALKDRGRTEILDRVTLHGRIPLPGRGQWVTVTVRRGSKVVADRRLKTNPETGAYRTRVKLKGCCDYTAQVAHGSDVSDLVPWRVGVPAALEPGRRTLLFNRLLAENGFHMGSVTDSYDASTALAILALRKTHDMERTESYEPALFRLLLSGDAAFRPAHTEDGRHVEVDISRQVMALVEDGVATDVFHVSTGAGGTPTGQWSFYSKVPGYNAKGMYYSVFYDGNYATHGYASVPTYPASHGCTRNPESYSVFIYDWIDLGDTMYVYS